jgi:DNA polymerase-3 subunit delta
MPGNNSDPPLASIYLVAGSEPLLVRDHLDQLRRRLHDAGYEDIQTLTADSTFDWTALLGEGDMLSLFASRKCRIVNIVSGKPGQKGSRAIQAICDKPDEETLFVFVVPGLDNATKNASWCKRLQQAGEVVELKPVYANQLPAWISQRAQSKGLNIDQQSAIFLAEHTEGNLLAADQELEKLSIRFKDQQKVDFETIEASVSQSARYTHFVLIDACLEGKVTRAMKILNSLRNEGYMTPQIRWALQSALVQLNSLKLAQSNGSLGDRVWQSMRIWKSKQRLYQQALSRLNSAQIERLLQSCATLDRVSKGQQDAGFPDQDWLLLRSLIAQLSGSRVEFT